MTKEGKNSAERSSLVSEASLKVCLSGIKQKQTHVHTV